MEIIKYPNDILRQKAQPIFKEDTDVLKTLHEMRAYIQNNDGAVGLALPQVGISKAGFVAKINDKAMIFINPFFLKKGPIYTPDFTEGCLSIDEQEGFVKRHKSVMMKYFGTNWKPLTISAEKFNAVVLQHEYDHLQGILFIDKLS